MAFINKIKVDDTYYNINLNTNAINTQNGLTIEDGKLSLGELGTGLVYNDNSNAIDVVLGSFLILNEQNEIDINFVMGSGLELIDDTIYLKIDKRYFDFDANGNLITKQ